MSSDNKFLEFQPWVKAIFHDSLKFKFCKYCKISCQSICAENPGKSAISHFTSKFFHSIKTFCLAFIFHQFVFSGQYQTKIIFAFGFSKIFCKCVKTHHHSHIHEAEIIISFLSFLFSL
jgi:hypothetical protein